MDFWNAIFCLLKAPYKRFLDMSEFYKYYAIDFKFAVTQTKTQTHKSSWIWREESTTTTKIDLD